MQVGVNQFRGKVTPSPYIREIRIKEKYKLSKLLSEIEESIEEEWLHGGDLEIPVPIGKDAPPFNFA